MNASSQGCICGEASWSSSDHWFSELPEDQFIRIVYLGRDWTARQVAGQLTLDLAQTMPVDTYVGWQHSLERGDSHIISLEVDDGNRPSPENIATLLREFSSQSLPLLSNMAELTELSTGCWVMLLPDFLQADLSLDPGQGYSSLVCDGWLSQDAADLLDSQLTPETLPLFWDFLRQH